MLEIQCVRNSKDFQKAVVTWFKSHGRTYPWRQTRDPFRILVAEIILKLTGANKVQQAYEYLTATYSTPAQMANADLEDLIRVFKVLGLFNRTKVLIEIAKDIEERFNGRVPRKYESLVSIKGVGQYTANAVLCFSCNKRVPLIDGRIYRLLSRYFSVYTDKTSFADSELWNFANSLLPSKGYREYNLGLLDLGATICKHGNPLCTKCPLGKTCSYLERRHSYGGSSDYLEPGRTKVHIN